MNRDGLSPKRDGISATCPCQKVPNYSIFSTLQGRVGTGRDGILHYSPLRARDKVNVFPRPLLSLLSLLPFFAGGC